MSTEQQQPRQGFTQASGRPPTSIDSDPNTESPAGYDELIRHFGEAMRRVAKLEAQVEKLTQQLGDPMASKDASSEDIPGAQAQSRQRLLGRIEELEAHLADTPPSPQPKPHEDTAQRDDEIAHLRLQLANLSQKLSRAEDDLKIFRGEPVRRRSRGRRSSSTPWWKFWHRRQSG